MLSDLKPSILPTLESAWPVHTSRENCQEKKGNEAFAYTIQRKILSKKKAMSLCRPQESRPPPPCSVHLLSAKPETALPPPSGLACPNSYMHICHSYFRTFLILFHAQGILNEQNGSCDITKLLDRFEQHFNVSRRYM